MSDCVYCNAEAPNQQGELSSEASGTSLRRVEPRQSKESPGATIKPAWVSYRDAEVYCSLSRVTLWRLISEGEIKAARCGRAVRISVDSLDAYLSRQASGDVF
jgi:excisionase family DNA binding protein